MGGKIKNSVGESIGAHQVIATACSLVVASIGFVSIFVWIFIPSLKEFSAMSMKFNTAVALFFGSAGLWVLKLNSAKRSKIQSRIGFSLALFMFAIGLATVFQYIFKINLGIDELFVSDFRNSESSLFPGRMSPIASLCFALLGAGLLFIDKPNLRNLHLTSWFVYPALLLSGISLLGYAYSESSLYQLGVFIRIAWQAAVSCLVLSIGILFARPDGGLIRILTSQRLGGMIARRLFPVVVFAPAALGLFWLHARRTEAVDRELGVSLFVVAIILIFICVIAFVARQLDLLDTQGRDLADKEKAAQKNLADTEDRFQMMANSIPQLAWMADKNGWIFWYNERWYEYTGTTLKDMEGWGWEKVHHPVELARASGSWKKALSTGEPWEDVFPLRSKTGEWRWFLSRARPMRDPSGEITFWFGTNTDIDEKLRVERDLKESKEIAEKANQAKTQFLANMSHEIRTPIGAIMGFTELMKNASTSPSDKLNFMTVIDRNSQNLLRLIDDILDLSKVEAGKIALENINFKLTELLADVASAMTLRAAEKGIGFALRLDGLIPDQICTDQLRLRQILNNIIGNAVKFTERGSVDVLAKYELPILQFTVSDTGPGIPLESRENLFQAFGQADPSMTRKFGGTGLGLILSKKLSHALGGDVSLIHSEVDNGSVFQISIEPKFVPDAKMVGQQSLVISDGLSQALDNEKGRLAGLRVLLVEDSPDNRMLLKLYLQKSGARVETANDGMEGLVKALETIPDVTLMDIQMPKLDGHAATKALRGKGFAKPIIALTAHAMREERDKCFESGCTDYLTKPINKELLIDVLSRYLPQREGPFL